MTVYHKVLYTSISLFPLGQRGAGAACWLFACSPSSPSLPPGERRAKKRKKNLEDVILQGPCVLQKHICSRGSSLMILQTLFYPLPFPSFPQIKNTLYRKIIIPSLPHPTTSLKKEKEKKNPLLFLYSPTHATSEPPSPLCIFPTSQPLPSPTIPINSDSPTHTTNQKPFLLNSFVVISLY